VPAAAIPDSLRAAAIPANLRFIGDAADLVFVQRLIDGRTVTFVHNRGETARALAMALPGVGGVTRWDAMDGSMAPVSARAVGQATELPLSLAAGESALLVLDPEAQPAALAPRVPVGSLTLPADGWQLRVEGHAMRKPYVHDFGPAALKDWRQIPELAQFAGTGTYSRSITVDSAWLTKGTKLVLDLGQVHDIATVTINGRSLPTMFSAPFRVDVTDLLRAGKNDLRVAVANVPQNGVIDASDPAYKTFKPVVAGWSGPAALEASR
jgi:hypothetical protein